MPRYSLWRSRVCFVAVGVLVFASKRIGVRALLGRDFGVLGLTWANGGLGEEA